MTIIYDVLGHVLNFEFAWLLDFILSNLHYLFAFAAIAYFFLEGRKLVIFTILMVIGVWAVNDWMGAMGWIILSGGFLGLLYITRVALVAFAEGDRFLKKKLAWVFMIHLATMLILYNIFMVG